MWRFAGVSELFRILGAVIVSFVLHTILIAMFFNRMPIVYYALGGLLQFIFAAFGRFSYRAYLEFLSKSGSFSSEFERKNAMIIGAGDAGQLILSDINKSASKYNVKCNYDDDGYINEIIVEKVSDSLNEENNTSENTNNSSSSENKWIICSYCFNCIDLFDITVFHCLCNCNITTMRNWNQSKNKNRTCFTNFF